MQPYTPLTEEQFNKSINAGYTPDQITKFEQIRKQQSTSSPQPAQQDFKPAGGFIGKVLTGSTQKFGNTIGQAINAPQAAQQYADVLKSHTDIQNNLLKAIQEKQKLGQDTSKLTQALHEHVQSAPNLENFTGDVINKTPGQVVAQGLGTALDVASLGSFGAAAKGLKALSAGEGIGADLAQSFKQAAPTFAKENTPTIIKPLQKGLQAAKTGIADLGTASKDKFITKLITPEYAKGEGIAAIKTGKVGESVGLNGARDISKTIPGFNDIKASVTQVPGIKSGNTLLKNNNLIHNAIETTAENLKTALKTQEITPIVNKAQYNEFLDGVKAKIAEDPFADEKTANIILKKFESFIPNKVNPEAIDILEARQKTDAWARGLKGGKAFDPKLENAFHSALSPIRTGANELVSKVAPDVKVQALLKHQSNLFRAIDAIAPKVFKEEASKAGRFAATRTGKVLIGAAKVGGAGLIGESLLHKTARAVGK